jgi:hypothetical protein
MIVSTPAPTPLSKPELDPITATVVLVDVQVPPGEASVRTVESFTHSVCAPDIGAGNASTVNVVKA